MKIREDLMKDNNEESEQSMISFGSEFTKLTPKAKWKRIILKHKEKFDMKNYKIKMKLQNHLKQS